MHGSDYLNDQAALSRRAERFQREHDIERNKGFQSHPQQNKSYNNSFYNRVSYYDNAEEPESDPVSPAPTRGFVVADLSCVVDGLGATQDSRHLPRALQGLSPLNQCTVCSRRRPTIELIQHAGT